MLLARDAPVCRSDTGAQHCFSVPLVRAWEIFRDAYQQISGMVRTGAGAEHVREPREGADAGDLRGPRRACEVLRLIQGVTVQSPSSNPLSRNGRGLGRGEKRVGGLNGYFRGAIPSGCSGPFSPPTTIGPPGSPGSDPPSAVRDSSSRTSWSGITARISIPAPRTISSRQREQNHNRLRAQRTSCRQ
jgi:hypothetical protein